MAKQLDAEEQGEGAAAGLHIHVGEEAACRAYIITAEIATPDEMEISGPIQLCCEGDVYIGKNLTLALGAKLFHLAGKLFTIGGQIICNDPASQVIELNSIDDLPPFENLAGLVMDTK